MINFASDLGIEFLIPKINLKVVFMKKFLLLSAAACMAAGAMAQLTPGEYYIKNVATGMFLNEGFSWGTLAVTKDYPMPFEVTVDGDGYLFKSHIGNGYIKAENGEYYMDGNDPVAAYLEEAGEFYNIKLGGSYLTINETKDYQTDEWLSSLNMCETLLYTVNQAETPKGDESAWQIISRADMVAALASATPEAPVQASFFLNAGEIQVNANDWSQASWTYIKNGEKAEIVFPDGGWFGHGEWSNKTTYAWFCNDAKDGAVAGTDVVYQDVEGMPAGNYKAVYRVVNQNNTPLVIKFNDTEAAPFEYEDSDLWYESAQNSMAHNVKEASFKVGEDGKLSLRMEKTISAEADAQNRFAFKVFSLYYLGNSESGVEAAVDENAPAVYYNMQGVRVANPSNGAYIKVQGKNATKVIVK